jgi:DNA (cytosine-5)-methyltransferase 1
VSLFAGCGGSSLGYEMAGYRELLAVDFDSECQATFNINFPSIPFWLADIMDIEPLRLLEKVGLAVGDLDVLDGSPPCQGFSMVGKRVIGDARNNLFIQFARILNGVKPKAFVAENVGGMAKGVMKGYFNEILARLESCGYNVACRMMNAVNYGVPQSRERLIFIGIRKDLQTEPLYPEPLATKLTVGEVLRDCPTDGENLKLCRVAEHWWPILKYGENAGKYRSDNNLYQLRKLDPYKPSPTVVAFVGGATEVHWLEPRYLSTREKARLCSFPDIFEFAGTRQSKAKQIGNSVPPLMMKAIAEHVKRLLGY